jgi:serine/threonine-protein kinase
MAVSRIGDFVGRVLGDRYRLLAPLGTGGSAHVFLAEDVRLRRRVAVKILHAALAEDEAFLKRFRHEAQAAAALNHPHIMRVYDWGEDGGDDVNGPFLVLEYLGGGSLRDLLDRGYRLSVAQAVLVGLEAAKGLDHAHRRGLVHRDIKPANLLFDDEGRLCVADFGVARALAEAAWTEPTGAVIGTARYASPEQARGSSADGRADIYALALTLVESVTGQVPFAADTTIATLMGRAEQPLVGPSRLGPLAPVVNAAGAIDPAERVDAAGFVRLLDQAARELDSPAPLPLAGHLPDGDTTTQVVDADPTMVAAIPEATKAQPATVAAAASPAAKRRRRRWPWVAAIVLVAALVAGGGLYARQTLLVPSHPVPALAGKTLDEARRIASTSNFDVKVLKREYKDGTVAGQILTQDPINGRSLKENKSIAVVVSRGPHPVDIPDLANKNEQQATEALAAAGLKVGNVDRPFNETAPKGQVLDWSPKTGKAPRDSAVNLVVSNGPAPVDLSDWRGKPFSEAKQKMESVGFKVQRRDVYSDAVPTVGHVVSTSPGPGKVEKGATIVVTVSQGPETVEVPDVMGMNLEGATRRLENAGFLVTADGRVRGRVVGQDPAGGAKAKRGSTVTIVLL